MSWGIFNEDPQNVHKCLNQAVRTLQAIQCGTPLLVDASACLKSCKPGANQGRFAGIRTTAMYASDIRSQPKSSPMPAPSLVRLHLHFPRFMSAQSGCDPSLEPPLKQHTGRQCRQRRLSVFHACSMPERRHWTGQDKYLPHSNRCLYVCL